MIKNLPSDVTAARRAYHAEVSGETGLCYKDLAMPVVPARKIGASERRPKVEAKIGEEAKAWAEQ